MSFNNASSRSSMVVAVAVVAMRPTTIAATTARRWTNAAIGGEAALVVVRILVNFMTGRLTCVMCRVVCWSMFVRWRLSHSLFSLTPSSRDSGVIDEVEVDTIPKILVIGVIW